MANTKAHEEPAITEVKESSTETKEVKKGAFSNVNRSLTDKDLENPAIGRMLLDQIDTLTTEKIELADYREKYYDADKKRAVLQNKVDGESKFQTLYSFTLTIGGTIVGITFSTTEATFQILLACGILLIVVGGILSIFVNKKNDAS